jgi:FkbM family methyltransferase
MLQTVMNPRVQGARRRFDVIRPYGDNLRIRLDTSSPIERQIIREGSYEPEIDDIIRHACTEHSTAIDVGASAGYHALIMAETVGEKGHVLALEPDAQAFSRLRDNIEMNALAQVETLSLAAGADIGVAPLPSLVQVESMHPLTVGSLALDPISRPEPDAVEVPVTTIDRLMFERECDRLDLIKIEAQGNEMGALRGARETIARFRPKIIFAFTATAWLDRDVSFASARAFFDAQRYELARLTPGGPAQFERVTNGNYLALPT